LISTSDAYATGAGLHLSAAQPRGLLSPKHLHAPRSGATVGNAVAHGEVLFLRVADGRVFAATGPAAIASVLQSL